MPVASLGKVDAPAADGKSFAESVASAMSSTGLGHEAAVGGPLRAQSTGDKRTAPSKSLDKPKEGSSSVASAQPQPNSEVAAPILSLPALQGVPQPVTDSPQLPAQIASTIAFPSAVAVPTEASPVSPQQPSPVPSLGSSSQALAQASLEDRSQASSQALSQVTYGVALQVGEPETGLSQDAGRLSKGQPSVSQEQSKLAPIGSADKQDVPIVGTAKDSSMSNKALVPITGNAEPVQASNGSDTTFAAGSVSPAPDATLNPAPAASFAQAVAVSVNPAQSGITVPASLTASGPAAPTFDFAPTPVSPVQNYSGIAKDAASAGITKHKAVAQTTEGDAADTITTPGSFSAVASGSPEKEQQHAGTAVDPLQQAMQTQSSHGVVVTDVHAAVTTSTADEPVPSLPVPAHVQDVEISTGGTTINASQLIHTMHQSEMRVGMNSVEFGDISISTSISHQVLSASISLGHEELGRALALHMPAMEEKLSAAYGLQTRVNLEGSMSSGAQDSSPQGRQGRQDSSASRAAQVQGQAMPTGPKAPLPISLSSPGADSSRLDVLF